MEDLARAAGISRQGLYLHFDTKEALFKAAVLRLVGDLRAAWQSALEREGADVGERVAAALEAMHGLAIGEAAAHMNELLETAAALVGPVVDEVERELVVAVARLFTTSGIAADWAAVGLSAKELAENVWAASMGLKYTSPSTAAYRKSMRAVVKMATKGAPATHRRP